MPDHVAVDLAYVAPVTCVPLRSRKERVLHARGVVTVPIAVHEARDAPVVLQARSGTRTTQRRLLGDTLMGPVGELYDNWPMGGWYNLNRFRIDVGQASQVAKLLFGWKQPWGGDHHDAPDLPAVERVLHDGRGAMEAAVREAARGLAVIGGNLYRKQSVPVLLVNDRSNMKVEITVHDGRYRPEDYSFGLARREALEDFVERNRGPGGYQWKDVGNKADFTIEEMEPSALAYAEDRPNAWVAVRKALDAVREMNPSLPPDAYRQMAELAEARDAVLTGGATAQDVAGHLRVFDEMRALMPGRPVAVKHAIRIGLDAIASSWSPETDLTEEDALAMGGMGPGL